MVQEVGGGHLQLQISEREKVVVLRGMVLGHRGSLMICVCMQILERKKVMVLKERWFLVKHSLTFKVTIANFKEKTTKNKLFLKQGWVLEQH